MIFKDSLTYPTEDEDWVKTVLIGGVLLIFSFLLIPALVAYGYLVRVMRSIMAGEPTPPRFGDWEELLVDGLKVWAISIVYMIVPFVVAGITVGGALLAFLTGTGTGTALGIAGLFGGLALSFVLSLVFGYFAVVAIVNFASEKRFGAAFDFETIFGVATDARYAVPWLVSVVVFVGVGVVGTLVGLIPLLGGIVMAFVSFYAAVVVAHLWASGYTEATADRRPESDVEERGDVAV